MIKILITMFVVVFYTQADTIYFKNGATIVGTVENQSEQTITVDGTTYSMSDVKSVSETAVAPPPTAPSPTPTATEASKQRLIGPSGATGVIRRSHRRQDRRCGASID